MCSYSLFLLLTTAFAIRIKPHYDDFNNDKVTADTAPLVQWCWWGSVFSEESLKQTNYRNNLVSYKWIVKDRMATELTMYYY